MKTIQELNQKILNDFDKDVTELIIDLFKSEKEVKALLMTLNKKENELSISIMDGLESLFYNEVTKALVPDIIKDICKNIKPIATVFITEGWMVKKQTSEEISRIIDEDGNYKKDAIKPAEDPDRIEVIMLSFESYKLQKLKCIEIIRKGDSFSETVELKEMTDLDIAGEWKQKDDLSGGNFTNLLQEDYDEWNMYLSKQMNENLN